MIRFWMCRLLSIHRWIEYPIDGPLKIRRCLECGLVQHTTYDMCYGGTYWVNGGVDE